MLLEIPEILRTIAPDLLAGGTPSVVCIRTTRPKYLIFGEGADRPVAVAEFGSQADLERLNGILGRIHARAPDLVAQPLALAQWKDGVYVQLQTGLPGTPWFRLSECARSRDDWDRIATQACAALTKLHAIVAACPEWIHRVRPGDELRRELATCIAAGEPLSARSLRCADRAADRLDALGEIDGYAQHGDFCLNNILLAPSGVAIIDFDEFGRSAMPLLDDAGLAMSLEDLMPAGLAARFDSVRFLLGRGASSPLHTAESIAGVRIHHLLWRINRAHGVPARDAARRGLLQKLERIAATSPAGGRDAELAA